MLRSLLLTLTSLLLLACGEGSTDDINSCGIEKPDIDKAFPADSATQIDSDLYSLQAQKGRYETPTERVPVEELPHFIDDLDFAQIEKALSHQEQRFLKADLSGTIKLGRDTYPLKRALNSIKQMKRISGNYHECLSKHSNGFCKRELHDQIVRTFKIYRPSLQESDPRYGEKKPVLFTGYYTPLITVSPVPKAEHKHAVYRRPNDTKKSRSERVDIDFRGVLANQGLESFFGASLFDLYLAHVQGNAKFRYMVDGQWTHTYMNYDGTNQKPWQFISKYMKEKGMIRDGSIQAQREYLQANPSRSEEIFSSCPSYVYLRPTTQPPYGSGNVPVTANRSIATDRNYYAFKGLLAFIVSKRPVESQPVERTCGNVEFRDYSRFVLDQDTGGAIRGKGRVDVYFGEGGYAELAASTTVERGELYFLISKH